MPAMRRQQRADRGHRQHDGRDAGQRAQHAGEPRREHREPGDERQRVHERKVEAVGTHDRTPDRERVQRERQREQNLLPGMA